MEELVSALNDIKTELQTMNNKLDDIKEMEVYNSISDVNEKLEDISSTLNNIDINTY